MQQGLLSTSPRLSWQRPPPQPPAAARPRSLSPSLAGPSPVLPMRSHAAIQRHIATLQQRAGALRNQLEGGQGSAASASFLALSGPLSGSAAEISARSSSRIRSPSSPGRSSTARAAASAAVSGALPLAIPTSSGHLRGSRRNGSATAAAAAASKYPAPPSKQQASGMLPATPSGSATGVSRSLRVRSPPTATQSAERLVAFADQRSEPPGRGRPSAIAGGFSSDDRTSGTSSSGATHASTSKLAHVLLATNPRQQASAEASRAARLAPAPDGSVISPSNFSDGGYELSSDSELDEPILPPHLQRPQQGPSQAKAAPAARPAPRITLPDVDSFASEDDDADMGGADLIPHRPRQSATTALAASGSMTAVQRSASGQKPFVDDTYDDYDDDLSDDDELGSFSMSPNSQQHAIAYSDTSLLLSGDSELDL